MTKALEGRIALVTGASRGIGAATAIALAEAGAHVVLAARTTEGLEATEEAIHQAGGTATIAPVDLTCGDSLSRLAIAVGDRWEALDILVLNAAMLGTLGPVPALDPTEFANLLTLNIGAAQGLLAAFDPLLRKAAHGRVIGLTSSVATSPRAFWGGYAASKAALEALLLAYAEETKALGDLRVAIVDPGATATVMRAKAYPGEDPATLKPPSAVADAIVAVVTGTHPSGHRARVEG